MNLRTFLKNSDWNYKVPGGFVTNFPQRKVNTYGDGRYINNSCNLKGSYWSSTFWTAKQTQNDKNSLKLKQNLFLINYV